MANSLKSFLLGAGFGIAACAGISQCKYNGKSELPVKQPIEELCKMKWCPYPALVCDTFDIQVSKNAQGGNDTIYSLSPKNVYVKKVSDDKSVAFALDYKKDTVIVDSLFNATEKQIKNRHWKTLTNDTFAFKESISSIHICFLFDPSIYST